MDELEAMMIKVSGGLDKIGALDARLRVAISAGYMDARSMVHLMETHGLPLSLCAQQCIEVGLKIDYSGLRYELERIGKKPDTIDSELREVIFFAEHAIAPEPTTNG